MYGILIQGSTIINGSVTVFLNYLNKTLSSLGSLSEYKVVVSTWESEREALSHIIDRYHNVLFVFSKDPGPIVNNIDGITIRSNLNRMLVSTLTGLTYFSSLDIVVKIRTDSYLTGTNWLNLLRSHSNVKRAKEYKLFDQLILCSSTFVRNPDSFLPFLYHPSDIMLVGLCKDLKILFDIPQATPDIIKIVKSRKIYSHFTVCPEQYIFLNAIENNITSSMMKPEFHGNFEFKESEKIKSNRYLINNFVFYSPSEMNLNWPKLWNVYWGKGWSTLYDHNDWKNLRNKYEGEYHTVLVEKIIIKRIMFEIGKMYFFFRTYLLDITWLRRIAYTLFSNRK